MRRRLLVAGVAGAALSVLSACAVPGARSVPGSGAGSGDAGRIGTGAARSAVVVDGRTGQRLDPSVLHRRVAASALVLLGERHDNPEHHRIRGELITVWLTAHRARAPAVAFEMLDREHDTALRTVQRDHPPGSAATDDLLARWLDAAGFDRKAWAWPMHRPLFEAALTGQGRWIGANFSRASARALMRPAAGGVAAAPDPTLAAVVESADWPDAARDALAVSLRAGHCNRLPENVLPAVARMQRLRDAALALPLRDGADRPTLLVAGNGHVRRDHGVPRYLGPLAADALVVGFDETGDPFESGRYDLIVVTRPAAREPDPCKGL